MFAPPPPLTARRADRRAPDVHDVTGAGHQPRQPPGAAPARGWGSPDRMDVEMAPPACRSRGRAAARAPPRDDPARPAVARHWFHGRRFTMVIGTAPAYRRRPESAATRRMAGVIRARPCQAAARGSVALRHGLDERPLERCRRGAQTQRRCHRRMGGSFGWHSRPVGQPPVAHRALRIERDGPISTLGLVVVERIGQAQPLVTWCDRR